MDIAFVWGVRAVHNRVEPRKERLMLRTMRGVRDLGSLSGRTVVIARA